MKQHGINSFVIILAIIIVIVLATISLYLEQQKNASDTNQVTNIEGGTVYYNDNGTWVSIAESIFSDDTDYKNYTKVELSPNKKFILLAGYLWESTFVEIYDISSKKIYGTEIYRHGLGEWLPDNRLRVGSTCSGDEGIGCNLYKSIDNEMPWILEKQK